MAQIAQLFASPQTLLMSLISSGLVRERVDMQVYALVTVCPRVLCVVKHVIHACKLQGEEKVDSHDSLSTTETFTT